MDIVRLIKIFSNGEKFVKRQQERRNDGTIYTFDAKRPDKKLRKRSFCFLVPRHSMEVRYVKLYLEDNSGNYLAAKIVSEKYLLDTINS